MADSGFSEISTLKKKKEPERSGRVPGNRSGKKKTLFFIQLTPISKHNYFRMYISFERDHLNSVYQKKPAGHRLMGNDMMIMLGLNQ